MPRPTRLELHLAPPEKLPHAVGTGVLDASLGQKIPCLSVGSNPPLLHDLLKLFPSLLGDKLLPAASLIYPAHKQLIQTAFGVGAPPPLALTAGCNLERRQLLLDIEHSLDFRSLIILTRWNR